VAADLAISRDVACRVAPAVIGADLRHRRDLPRVLATLWCSALDIKLMKRIRWTGAFASPDAVLARYTGLAEALPAW
jgi:hypothetical protein